MQDHTVHKLLGSKPDQTMCGKNPFGLKTTENTHMVNCPKCLSVMEKVQVGGDRHAKVKTKRWS
jgi:Zn finger protein HypA/HybF involved in hydrogenase expression